MERYGVPNLPRLGDRPRAKDVTEKSAFVAERGATKHCDNCQHLSGACIVYHTAIVMKVVEGKLDAYRTDHQNLWPDIDRAMRRERIDMAIYHYNGFLFVFATAPSEQHWERSRIDPVFAAWNAHMANLLVSDDKGNILFYPQEKVFGFGSFT